MQRQRAIIAKIMLKMNNKEERFSLSSFKTYYVSIVIQNGLYCQKDRHIDQWNKTENH